MGVDFWVQNRVDDLVRALSSPGKNEHMPPRAPSEKRGYGFRLRRSGRRVKEYLLANLKRMQKEFAGFQEQLRALRAANKLSEAKMLELDSHLFRTAAFPSTRTFVRTSPSSKRSKRSGCAKGVQSRHASVHRVAIIGPGLDFVNKEEGVDFYPTQTIQPFAVIDSLLKLKLADPTALK